MCICCFEGVADVGAAEVQLVNVPQDFQAHCVRWLLDRLYQVPRHTEPGSSTLHMENLLGLLEYSHYTQTEVVESWVIQQLLTQDSSVRTTRKFITACKLVARAGAFHLDNVADFWFRRVLCCFHDPELGPQKPSFCYFTA